MTDTMQRNLCRIGLHDWSEWYESYVHFIDFEKRKCETCGKVQTRRTRWEER